MMKMPVRAAMLVTVVLGVVQVGWCFVPTHNQLTKTLTPTTDCRDIKFTDPSRRSAVRESVLRAMCTKAAPHLDLTDKIKQFAVFLLQRDDFDDQARWHSGEAKDVLADPYWVVNQVEELPTTKYHWYSHGLPMWPLPHQALPNTTTSKLPSLKKKKPVDWPNYGFATPIYFASNAWRNQAWSLEEFFQQKSKKTSPFKSHKDFHKLAKDIVANLDGLKVESYSEWPFLKYSLVPMVKSMVERNKGLCPDDLYIYHRVTPCHPSEAAHLSCAQAALDARTLLTLAACRTTNVIVGYTQDYTNDAL
ncbi:uncharacterized protein [Procambarus clarkii]|uniref:uncharacterized protein isoform X2 n=1 Tax=Procambarus clarkii TaxID=6728 RepID=UPI001E677F6B|nr:uncharacterized protein LOC123768700 [Procambarus clarkii]